MSKEPCKFCGETHVDWWDECNAAAAASQAAAQSFLKPKELPPHDPREPIAFINEWGIKSIRGNNGVLAKVAFDQRLSTQANNVQDIPLYTAPPVPPRVDVPTEEGWYWLYMDGLLTIEKVFKRPGHEYLAVQSADAVGLMGKRVFLAVAKLSKAEWYGPIMKPEL